MTVSSLRPTSARRRSARPRPRRAAASLLAVGAVSLLGAPAALGEDITASQGSIQATLVTADDGSVLPGMRTLTVRGPDGADHVFGPDDLPVGTPFDDTPWRIESSSTPLTVRDVDADGQPEVILDAYWGGAHCCFLSAVLRWDAAAANYRPATQVWGNFTPRRRDDDGDGRVEWVGRDDRFAYAFGSYAGSVPPVRVWRLVNGRFADVTRTVRRYALADQPRLWREYRRRRAQGSEWVSPMAAYIATGSLLGKRGSAVRRVRATGPTPRVLRGVLNRLNAWGYR